MNFWVFYIKRVILGSELQWKFVFSLLLPQFWELHRLFFTLRQKLKTRVAPGVDKFGLKD